MKPAPLFPKPTVAAAALLAAGADRGGCSQATSASASVGQSPAGPQIKNAGSPCDDASWKLNFCNVSKHLSQLLGHVPSAVAWLLHRKAGPVHLPGLKTMLLSWSSVEGEGFSSILVATVFSTSPCRRASSRCEISDAHKGGEVRAVLGLLAPREEGEKRCRAPAEDERE